MGELHLDIIVDRMKREFKVEANVGKPQVAYRETIRTRSSRKASSFASPAVAASTATSTCASSRWSRVRAYEFENAIVGGVVPKEYIPAVDKGVQEQMENGVIAGYPVVDCKVTLYDGSYHDVDSSEMAFKIAGSMAFKEGATEGRPGCSSRS